MESYQPPKYCKYCFIPECNNNDQNNPGLVFVKIPNDLKENWCRMIGKNKCPKRNLYCCENHLSLENDLENYMYWKTMGGYPRLKSTALLKNITKRIMHDTVKDNGPGEKRKKYETLGLYKHGMEMDCELKAAKPDQMLKSKENASSTEDSSVKIQQVDAAIQYNTAQADKKIMAKPTMKDKSTNYRVRKLKQKVLPSRSNEQPGFESSPSLHRSCTSLYGSSNIDTNTSSNENIQSFNGRNHLLDLATNKPKMYLGLPKNFFWVLDYIVNEYKTNKLNIILTLFKIKNNDSFMRMADEWQISRSSLQILFHKTVELLTSFFQNLIYLPSPLEIKKNLPLVFKIRYTSVQCIIDCFEIEIEKPSDPIKQAQTWSQYKSCNTIKYLIACTPNGLISFVSKGFGGRISDKALTEKSGFIDILPTNAVVMADRGFKELESLLYTKNIKLLRPPSVFSDRKPTKAEVIQSKVTASLRVHVERTIRRVREFRMLKPHSVIHHLHLKYLDEMVVIACGLINLQSPIIKDCKL